LADFKYYSLGKILSVTDLAAELGVPGLPILIGRFLFDQLNGNSSPDVTLPELPVVSSRLSIHYSATTTFYAPSDLSGVGGMRREQIRATPSWRKGKARYDCALINVHPDLEGMRGLYVARILQFFSFEFEHKIYPCAVVRWFTQVGEEPDEDTGMWIVEPECDQGDPVISVIHLDCILRAAHLIPVYGNCFIPENSHFSESLNSFQAFYVNKFADHHAFETAI
jgi:hypothetical protein